MLSDSERFVIYNQCVGHCEVKKAIRMTEAAVDAKLGAQEPVAVIDGNVHGVRAKLLVSGLDLPDGTNLYTHPAPVQTQPEPVAELVELVGVKNGVETSLGKVAMPPRMKAREIAREQFGAFQDDDGSDADFCFGALETLIDWMFQQGYKLHPAPVQQEPIKDHEVAAMVNRLRHIATVYHDHQSLRERIAQEIRPMFTAPVQQDEVEKAYKEGRDWGAAERNRLNQIILSDTIAKKQLLEALKRVISANSVDAYGSALHDARSAIAAFEGEKE